MDYSAYEQKKQRDRERKLLEQHLEKVRERWKSQDLSILEMHELKDKLMTESDGAAPAVRDRLEAELSLLNEVIAEEDPAPTIEDEIASLRAHGLKNDADELEHAHRKVSAREEVARLRAELQYPDLPGYQKAGIESTLQKALDDLAQLESHNPAFEREDRMRSLRSEAEVLQDQINRMGNPASDASRRIYNELDESRKAKLEEAYALEQGETGLEEGDAA